MKSLRILLLFSVEISCVSAQTKTWQSYFYENGTTPPVILGNATLVEPPLVSPPSWVGTASSIPAGLYNVIGAGNDSSGNLYALYKQAGAPNSSEPFGYISQTTVAVGMPRYFGLSISPSALGVSPYGDVFIIGVGSSGIATIYQLNPNGQLTVVFVVSITFSDVGNGFSGPMTVDENDDISVTAYVLSGAGTFLPATYLFVTTGPVPNAIPLANTYPDGSSISI